MDVEKFIRCVKIRDEIYNKANTKYNQRGAVVNAWIQIAREMRMSVLDCKEKWHNLRSNYMRERKKIIGPGSKKWHLLDSLSFLEPHHSVRISIGQTLRSRQKRSMQQQEDSFVIRELYEPALSEHSFQQNQTNHDKEDMEFDINQENSNSNHHHNNNQSDSVEPVQIIEVESLHQSPSINEQPKRKRRKYSKNKKYDDIDGEYLKEVRKLARHLRQSNEDSDRMFLLSLLPMVKQLSPKENLDFRVEVQKFMQRKLMQKYDYGAR